jgi:hypothetical protein
VDTVVAEIDSAAASRTARPPHAQHVQRYAPAAHRRRPETPASHAFPIYRIFSTMGHGVSKDGAVPDGVKVGEKIGAGGFSEVYKGSFKDGRP